jgi:hypothetical protein
VPTGTAHKNSQQKQPTDSARRMACWRGRVWSGWPGPWLVGLTVNSVILQPHVPQQIAELVEDFGGLWVVRAKFFGQ